MAHKIVSQLDSDDIFVGPVIAYESPLEPGVFHIPGGAVDVAPVTVPDGKRARWVDPEWVLEELPKTTVVEPIDTPDASQPDPIAKLRLFLTSNPDVIELVRGQA